MLILPNGLVLDHTNSDVVSCAATGLVSYSRAIAGEKEGIKEGFRNTIKYRKDGWLYHFTDSDGVPLEWSEVSTVDTAIFFLSMREAARLIGDEELEGEVEKAITEINVECMLENDYFKHGYKIDLLYDDYSEGILIYDLLGREFNPRKVKYDLPLFVYYYPLLFPLDENERIRRENYLCRAIQWQRDNYGYVGVTACNSPWGYQVNHPQIISPLSVYGCRNFLLSKELGYPLVDYITIDGYFDWYGPKYAIDWASCFIMNFNGKVSLMRE